MEVISEIVEDEDDGRAVVRLPEPIAAEMVEREVTQEIAERVLFICLPVPIAVGVVRLDSSFTMESVASPVPLPIQFVQMEASDSFKVVSFLLDEPIPTAIVVCEMESLETGIFERGPV